MSSIISRLNQELETFGRRAQSALDEGRLQIEVLRLRRKRDTTAMDLGRLYHKRERGGEVPGERIEGLLLRMDELEAAIRKTERQMGAVKAEAETVETPDEPEASDDRHPDLDESTQATSSDDTREGSGEPAP
jgi:hypothetical protein